MFEELKLRQREKAEDMLREALSENAIGLFVVHLKKSDRVHAYPTKNPHIHKISLTLRRQLDMSAVIEILRDHLLSTEEFGKWNAKQWEL